MKKWNTIGWVKSSLILLLSLPNLFVTIPERNYDFNPVHVLFPIIAGAIMVYVLNKVRKGSTSEIQSSLWNSSPFTSKTPLIFFQFGAFFFMSHGVSTLLSTAIHIHKISPLGIQSLSMSIGVLLGIKYAIKFEK